MANNVAHSPYLGKTGTRQRNLLPGKGLRAAGDPLHWSRGASMHGQFVAVGEEGFPFGEEIRCSAFVWQCPPRFGKFKIRFLCPVEEQPRRFFIEAFLKDLKRSSPSAFVDQACQCGAKILKKIEIDLGLPVSDERAWPAVFRQRNAGHIRVTRPFDDVTDFLKYDRMSRKPELILPGADTPSGEMPATALDGYERKKRDANYLLQTHLPEKKRHYRDSDVIADLRKMIDAQAPGAVPVAPELSQFPLDTFPHRGPIDPILVDGVQDRGMAVEFADLCGKVGGAVINGLSYAKDVLLAQDHTEEFAHFVNRVNAKVRESKTAGEFDRWFKNEREHSFVRLLGIRTSSDESKERGKAFFRVLLWISYEMMSRCYGALMLVAWLDFCTDASIGPSDLEQLLFRRMHAPQYYLAGLPVVFLGRSQLRFIAEPLLRELWAPAKVWQPEAYRPLADMLSCYAFLNVQRRSADRDEETGAEKAPKIITTGNVPGEVVPEEQELDIVESLPMLSSRDCQTCGKALQPVKILSEPKDDIMAVRLYCAECDKYQSNHVSLSWLESQRQNAPVQS